MKWFQDAQEKPILVTKIMAQEVFQFCKEWLSYIVFYKWCIDNNWEVGLNVDRQDNNGNYEPSNCRIVSYKINNNNKRNNIVIEYKGETKTLMQWAQSLNLNYEMLYARFKRHNPIPEKLFAQ